MHPSRSFFQSRLASGRHGSLRVSAEPSPLSASFTSTDNPSPEQDFALNPTKVLGEPSDDLVLAPEQADEGFEEITYDELRLSLCPADPTHFAPVFDYQRAYHPSLLSRSRTSLSRLRKLSQASLKKSREVIGRTRRRSTGSDHTNPLAIAIRRPSVDSSQSSATSSSPKTPTQSHSTLLLDNHPFFKSDSSVEEDHPIIHVVPHAVTEPEDIVLGTTPRTPKARSITSSLKRIRTLSKASLFSSARKHAPQVCQILSPEDESSCTPSRSSSPLESIQIPELVFEQIDLSVVFEEDQPFSSLSLSRIHSTPASLDPATPRIEVVNASPRISSASNQLRLPQFQFVDPRSLAASAPPSAIERPVSLFGSAAPSPAWLSRNVQNLEVNVPVDVTTYSPAPLPIPPPPSPPLYIVPRSLRPDTYYLRGPEVEFEFTTAPQTPQSTSSSLTLYNPSQRDSFLAPSSIVRPRPASANRLSVIYRRSIVDSRRSIHSVVSYSEEREGQDVVRNTSLNVYVVSSEDSEQSLAPLALENPLSTLPDPKDPGSPTIAPAPSPYEIFVPHPKAHEYSEAVNFQPPPYLITFVKQILRSPSMNMDIYNKEADTVDWGGEADYSGYEWFKDPPERHPPPPQPEPSTMDNYVPQPGVIEQNEAFDYALKSAPNVLYARFKQFGQLGVLAWSSEFSELIDALKQLGFEGNMFVSTRTQALKTCEEILRLNLNIEMQIIVMFLSSQIARLRRFLDSDRQWDDYPKPQFPLDYTEYPRER